MPDVNKVMKGLECCFNPHSEHSCLCRCADCPYNPPEEGDWNQQCQIELNRDALVLLKEYKAPKTQPQWIPIEDTKKPEHNQTVWVAYRISYNGEIGTRLAKYRDYGKTHWLNIWDAVFWEDVVAWMPLENPEPPKEGSEAE